MLTGSIRKSHFFTHIVRQTERDFVGGGIQLRSVVEIEGLQQSDAHWSSLFGQVDTVNLVIQSSFVNHC